MTKRRSRESIDDKRRVWGSVNYTVILFVARKGKRTIW